MKRDAGVEVEKVEHGSEAEKAGLLKGDYLVAVNGHAIRDSIDFMFYGNEGSLELMARRGGEKVIFNIEKKGAGLGSFGLVLKHFKIKTCRNNCIFCFVSQLPRGLRKALYVKDEDYRMSFLYGNYITLTNLSQEDKERIVEQRLSPLYISVHCTDTGIRNRMIGNPKANDVLREIKFLADNRIFMHVQIVLCPGHNDDHLAKTIDDLSKFYPYINSIAVVPVGLTAHRKKVIRPVGREDAVAAITVVQKYQARFKRKYGECIVYASDELYIKGEMPFPPLENYGDLPQIENGVGMVPVFVQQAKRMKIPPLTEGKRFLTFTGTSFYPYLAKFIEKIRKAGITIEAVATENTFFGTSVSVTGLLTGRDVMRSLSGVVTKDDILLIPDVVMREGDRVFLDGVSEADIEDVLGVKTVVIAPTPAGLVEAITKLS